MPAAIRTLAEPRPASHWLAGTLLDGLRRERLARIIAGAQPRASQQPPAALLQAHDSIRDQAQAQYQRAVNQSIAALEAQRLAELKRKEEAEEARRKRRREELDALLLLLFLAGVAIYRFMSRNLAAFQPPGALPPLPRPTPAPGPTNAPPSMPGAITPTLEAPGEAEEFAGIRGPHLSKFLDSVSEAFDKVIQSGKAAGLTDEQIAKDLDDLALGIETGHGVTVAATETQATYGSAQIRLLKTAGFMTKIWATMEDERVRPSHVECGEQGAVLMDKPFINGLMYPGDPKGPPEEIINCRCWLVGGQRLPSRVQASEPIQAVAQGVWQPPWLESLHPRETTGKFTAKPENYGLTKLKGMLGRMGYYGSTDPAVRLSVQVEDRAIFVTRIDAVVPGQGAGSKALRRIKDFAAATGRRVELTAGADSPELQLKLNAFYERHGFTKTDEAEHPSFVWEPPQNRTPWVYEKPYTNSYSRAVEKAIRDLAVKGEAFPRPVAGAIVINDQGKLLMARSSFSQQGWFFPKGGQDEGEQPAEASSREAREEAGIETGSPVLAEPVELPASETYGDLLGFGSPRTETRGLDPTISRGAAELLSKAAAKAGLSPNEYAQNKLAIYDDLAERIAVRWASHPSYYVFRVQGEPGKAGPEAEEVRWVSIDQAKQLQPLHLHAQQILGHPEFAKLVAHVTQAEPIKSHDQTGHKFYGNQWVKVAADATAKMEEAIAHFKAVVSGDQELGKQAVKLLLESRAAFKAVPWDHPSKAALGKLGDQVVQHGLAAGVKYVGGGQVSVKPQKPAKLSIPVVKPVKSPGQPKMPSLPPSKAPPPSSAGQPQPTQWATPLTPAGVALNQARVDRAGKILEEGKETPDAVLQVIESAEPSKMEFVKAITKGAAAHRALIEYRDTPRADLECLSAVVVEANPVYGQANCQMASRKLTMGSTSVTGDFRHELGHALHGAMTFSPILNAHIHQLHAEAMFKAKSNPAGMQTKLDHEFYETTYGVIGRRAMDAETENVAEHYRGYHKAVYQTRTKENPEALKKYRERFPGWARLWDAWYSGAIKSV